MPPRYIAAVVLATEPLMDQPPHVVIDTDGNGVCCSKLLTAEEAGEKALALNERAEILAHWPKPSDPEVQALVNSEDWVPSGQLNLATLNSPVYRLHQAAETVARRRIGKLDA